MTVLDPTSVKVILTTKWSGSGYKSTTIRRVQSYSVESNIDSDADPWSIELGNPHGDLNAVLERDNEVRAQIFGAGKGVVYLLTGIMDDAYYNEQGNLQLGGRDWSCIATDSTHFPAIYRGMTALKIIEDEARKLGFSKFKLSTNPKGGAKLELTDGSESYWEFWYRMMRRDGKWLWTMPDGTLVAGLLNYSSSAKYNFASASVAKKNDILVEAHNVHKSTQSRVGRIAVEWRSQKGTQAGNPPILTLVEDATTGGWKKRPDKIVQDRHARTVNQAIKMGREEVFESKVGAIEVLITVDDPGVLIRQDEIATLKIPEHGLDGTWYIVGSAARGDGGGFSQDVRLRELKFAVSKRVPEDPTWPPDSVGSGGSSGNPIDSSPTPGLAKKMGDHPEWWECFIAAGQASRGSFALDLYVATLLAICDHETSFRNIRSNDQNNGSGKTMPAPGEHGVEWYDINEKNPSQQELNDWKTNFANEGGTWPGLTWSCAVGPMQLFSETPKRNADDIFKKGNHDQWFGGRWDACSNIKAAAAWLHQWAVNCGLDNGNEDNLWKAVCSYGYGGCTNTICDYGANIRDRVKGADGWLAAVQEAFAEGSGGGGGGGGNGTTYVFPVEGQDAANFNDLGGPCSHLGPPDNWQSNWAHDIGARPGTKIFAVADGTIESITNGSDSDSPLGYAYAITLKTADGEEFWYGHLTGDFTGLSIAPLHVKEGAIRKGDTIAYVNRWDNHLHIGINYNGSMTSNNCHDPKGDPVKVIASKPH